MTPRHARRDLHELARLHGVQRSYEDVSGQRRHASPEALVLTLRALGVPVEAASNAADALRAREAALGAPGTDPVHVAWGGRLSGVHLRVGARAAATPAQLTLRLETGEVRTWRAPFEPARVVRGRAPAHRLAVRGPLPYGYHELEIETAGQTLRTRLIAAPRRAFQSSDECAWGVFAPLYAVRTKNDDGAGDFDGLARLAAWAGEQGGGYVGTLPLLPSFADEPFEPSPYSPASRIFWNELYVAPADARPRVRGDAANVDYRAVAAQRRAALQAESDAFFGSETRERAEFEQFAAGQARLDDYARFRATCDHFRAGWHAWPQALRNGALDGAVASHAAEQYYRYAQWRADQQLGGIARRAADGGAALYLDLPLGVNPDGYDAWRFREVFVEGASAGAPPDALFTGGQDWGFRPLSPDRLRATGYAYLIESVRHHLKHASMLRLDHVMWLFRLYWIPAGLSARDGVYVKYPADEMLAVLLTESARHRARIVGEDLGTVPRAVRAAMDRRHIQRIFVVQYEMAGNDTAPLNRTPRNAVASVNTHDMPPFAGFLDAAEVADQLDLGLIDEREAADARAARAALVRRLHAHFGSGDDPRLLLERLLRHLAASDARAVLVNLEDLWLETRSQNVPGTSHERPNWQRRFTRTLEQIIADPDIAETLRALDELRCGARPADSPNPTDDHV